MKTNMKFYITVLFAVLFVTACTDKFEEINTNPNVPGVDLAAPDMLLTNAVESMTDRVHEIFLGHEMGSCWAQHMAKAQYTDEDRYIPRVAVINTTWASFYAASGQDAVSIYEVGMARENENYMGVALVLKAYITSVVTDLFGDIPYTEAWKATAEEPIASPAFDTQESIYRDIIAKLDEANSLLDDHGAEISGDILFGNDIMAWKKFANSLRIRLLMRMSGRDAALATTEISKIVGDPATYPIFEGNEDNAALAYLGSAPNNNPINENRKTRDDHRVSENLINMLYADVDSPDWRVSLYANLAEGIGDYVGMPNGLTSADAGGFNGNGLANTSKIGDFYTQASAPGMLMSYPELQFLLAEAAHKGFIPGGDAEAEAYYVEGITASYYQNEEAMMDVLEIWRSTFLSWGWDPADMTILEFALDDFLTWGGWVYQPNKAMEQIATQKYVAMFDQGLQSWFEWRRTGYPVLTPAAAGANGGKIPVRVYYPSDEAARNPTNLKAAVDRLGADDMNTRVWWDVD
jgi:hypothetical protein